VSCYQSDVYVPQYDEYGEDIGGHLFFTGCHQNYVDTISEAVALFGFLNVGQTQCLTSQYEEGGTFRFYCVDSQNGPFDSYAFHLSDRVPSAAYTGPKVASIRGGSNEFGSLPDYPQQKGSDMQCVTIGEGGTLVLQNPQPANISECGMVVLSGSEAMGNPFALSSEAGAAISVAIIGVWAVAFGIRAAIQTLFLKGSNDEEVPA
jgi:hypothetical protein